MEEELNRAEIVGFSSEQGKSSLANPGDSYPTPLLGRVLGRHDSSIPPALLDFTNPVTSPQGERSSTWYDFDNSRGNSSNTRVVRSLR